MHARCATTYLGSGGVTVVKLRFLLTSASLFTSAAFLHLSSSLSLLIFFIADRWSSPCSASFLCRLAITSSLPASRVSSSSRRRRWLSKRPPGLLLWKFEALLFTLFLDILGTHCLLTLQVKLCGQTILLVLQNRQRGVCLWILLAIVGGMFYIKRSIPVFGPCVIYASFTIGKSAHWGWCGAVFSRSTPQPREASGAKWSCPPGALYISRCVVGVAPHSFPDDFSAFLSEASNFTAAKSWWTKLDTVLNCTFHNTAVTETGVHFILHSLWNCNHK